MAIPRFAWTLLCGVVLTAAGGTSARASDFDARQFGEQIAGLLEKRCVGCHGDERRRGKLSLATLAAARQGGRNGPAIVPGKPEESLLLRMVGGDEPRMPKKGAPLSADEVDRLAAWIRAGAPWPDGRVLRSPDDEAESTSWCFRPLVQPAVPKQASEWIRTPVDAFVLAKLRDMGLTPSAAADRRTLIRRLTFDLHGLPPSPAEIDAFLTDRSPKAYENLVNRLLASPRYGERWGRHWLDVVHYADTHGYDKDKRRDHAWPYRDYVIQSFNENKPYAQFIREQLAGDVLFADDPERIVATGFIAAGPWDYVGHVELREGTVDKLKTRLIDRDDMVTTTLSTFQSLTVHCARCHDHKFDPIVQEDYYRLQAVFAGVDRGDRPIEPADVTVRRNAVNERIKKLSKQLEELKKKEGEADDVGTIEAQLTKAKALAALLPPLRSVYAIKPVTPRPIHVLARGNVLSPQAISLPGTLAAMSESDAVFPLAATDREGLRRAALAEWIASEHNVLTWRSIVNRIWQYHFGRGLVDTPNDFGANGAKPTHPELLDWLAVEFRRQGGSFKALHRLLVTSAVYRQQSSDSAAGRKADGDNRFLWRMNRRRLEAEAIRDAVLTVSGQLDLRMGGPGYEPFGFEDDHSPRYDYLAVDVDAPDLRRRTVYQFIVRSVPDPYLEALDCADPNVSTPVRTATLTALQAFVLLNDPFMIRQAEHFAQRLEQSGNDLNARIGAAYRIAFGRSPSQAERDAVVAYAARHGMPNACRLLLNTNEFVFID